MPAQEQRRQFSFPGKPPEDFLKQAFRPKEEPLMAPPPEQSLSTSPMDLTTVANVKDWLSIPQSNTSEDSLIQACITANGFYWLWRCGLGNQNGVNTQSPLNSVCTFNETYDGNGSARFYLRNRPIQSVIALLINGNSVPVSPAYGQAGYVIDGDAKSLSIRTMGGGSGQTFSFNSYPISGFAWFFAKGIQNVNVQYTAGYSVTPFDVEQASKKIVALNFRSRDWIGEKSRAMAAGAGTVTYGTWAMDEECERVMLAYQRESMY